MFTCRNPRCGRIFDKPLKTVNLHESRKPYQACPFCLAKIETQQEEVRKIETEEIHFPKEKPSRNQETPPSCQHHVGYLSERQEKQQIPDECIVCSNLLECMLQKMKS